MQLVSIMSTATEQRVIQHPQARTPQDLHSGLRTCLDVTSCWLHGLLVGPTATSVTKQQHTVCKVQVKVFSLTQPQHHMPQCL